jgi:hypothetical protein
MAFPRVDEKPLLFEYDVPAGRWWWSEGLRALHGLSTEDPATTEVLLSRMVAEQRDEMTQRFEKHLVTPGPYTCAYEMRDAAGRLRRLRYVGFAEADHGRVSSLHGIVLDITDMLRQAASEAVEASAEHRAVIEQAKGALMLSFNVDDAAAFDLLRSYSSRSNTKLVQIAQRIVDALPDRVHASSDPGRNLLNVLGAIDVESRPPSRDADSGEQVPA